MSQLLYVPKADDQPESIRARFEVQYPAPLDEAAYHGLVGEIVRVIEPHSEADPVALLMNLLSAFGNVIGAGSWFMVGADKHPCNLFCVYVGDTAKGRKGTSWNPIRTLFEAIDPYWTENRIQTGLASGEGLIWHVRNPVFKGDEVVDEGVIDKRLFILEGELAQTLKVLSREGNTLSPVLRNAWDSDNLQTLTKNSPTRSTGAHVSIIGHITKQELIRALNEIETGNGFANRFLWLCVRRSKILPFAGDFDPAFMKPLTDKLSEAVVFAKQSGEVKWAESTRPLWASIYPELSEGKPGIIGAITARAEAQVTRLACIYALLDRSKEIRPEHLRAALAIWDYAEESVRYIFQNISGDPLADRIVEALKTRPDGLTRTEINNLLGGNYSTKRITEALEWLRVRGIAYMRKDDTGGRPVERWFLTDMATEKTE